MPKNPQFSKTLLLIMIAVCQHLIVFAQDQTLKTSQVELYLDSVYGLDIFPGTYSFPMRSLNSALKIAQIEAPQQLVLYLFPRAAQYSLYNDTVINNKNLSNVKIQTVEQTFTNTTDIASVLLSGNIKVNMSSLLFERVLIGNDNNTNNSMLSLQAGNLEINQSKILLSSQFQQSELTGLFDISQSNVTISHTIINFLSDSQVMQAAHSKVTFLNISMNCELSSQLIYVPFVLDQSDLVIDTMIWRGIQSSRSVDVATPLDNPVFEQMVGTLLMKNILYIPGNFSPIKLFVGRSAIQVSIQNFTVKDSILGANMFDFGSAGNNSIKINITGFYIQDNQLYWIHQTGSDSSGLIVFGRTGVYILLLQFT